MKIIRLIHLMKLALLGINLATLSLFFKGQPRAARDYLLRVLFDWGLITGRGLEERNFWDIFILDGAIRIDRSSSINYIGSGTVSHGMDLIYLCMIAQAIKPKIVFEIGTYWGVSTLHFAINTAPDTDIYTLDLDPISSKTVLEATSTDRVHQLTYSEINPVFANPDISFDTYKKIKRLYDDSACFDFTPFYNKIDLFYVDGSHSYPYVKSDSEHAIKCCHEGSVLVWHDYGRFGLNGVTTYLNGLSGMRQIYRLPGSSLVVTII